MGFLSKEIELDRKLRELDESLVICLLAFDLYHCHRGDSQGADNTWKRARSLFRGSTRAFPEVLPEDEAVRELLLCDKVEI